MIATAHLRGRQIGETAIRCPTARAAGAVKLEKRPEAPGEGKARQRPSYRAASFGEVTQAVDLRAKSSVFVGVA
jgi:hypothetical protein